MVQLERRRGRICVVVGIREGAVAVFSGGKAVKCGEVESDVGIGKVESVCGKGEVKVT